MASSNRLDIPMLGDLPTVTEIQERVNKRYDEMIHVDKSNKRHALVCSVCDEFLLCSQDISVIPIKSLIENAHCIDWDLASDVRDEVKTQYKFHDRDNHCRGNVQWLNSVALSPRGVIMRKKNHHKSPYGFSSCNGCKSSVLKGETPLYAIVNQNYVGSAPKCLTDLSEIELAFVSPVKGFGYCFMYGGGGQKQLRGQLTFMRVEPRKIARATAHLGGMGLNKHIVVIISGGITKDQKGKIIRKNLRVDKVIAAVEWLCANNSTWSDVDLEKYKEELRDSVPTVIDNSTEVESVNANVEQQELFSCYYPDGNVNTSTGGFETNAAFKEYVHRMSQNGHKMDVKIDLGKEFLKGRDGDELISSSLLQFPYGVGGLDESRVRKDGSFTNKTELEPFLAHLTKLSNPVFHGALFQLVVYSMISRLRLLRRSKLHLKSEKTAELIANGVRHQDVKSAVKGRKAGDHNAGTKASRSLLKAVDGMSRHLPHSNEAAKGAKNQSDGMQAYFGSPHIFLTVTFDDQNGLIIQIMARQEIDDDTPFEDVTQEQLNERSESRRQLRLNFPGVSSVHFEMMLQITVEEVCGWNMRTNKPYGVGLFGVCEALAISFEEQGRKTLHGHMSLWIKHMKRLRENFYFSNRNDSQEASGDLSKYYESVCTTDFFGSHRNNRRCISKMLDHPCDVPLRQRSAPVVISDQELRNLRHKHGYEASGGRFASCPHCEKWWTYEQMVALHAGEQGGHIVPTTLSSSGEVLTSIPIASMQAKTVAFQKKRNADVLLDTPSLEINACYNQHASKHPPSCFKCQKNGSNKKKHTCGPTCECRLRYPDRGRDHSQLKVLKKELPWFKWSGEEVTKDIIQVLPKRGTYDLFQNTACKAISESKLACNSNVQMITDGPIGQYQFKYIWKATNDDETAEYAYVCASIKNLDGRVHDDDKAEAIRVIRRAAFAHNRHNVIGAPMASYLTRHDSRFYFSHAFTYCPLRDLMRLVKGDGVSAVAKFLEDGNVYFENIALHYLCRPVSLESVSVRAFYEEWYVKRIAKTLKSTKNNIVYRFKSTKHFKHPSETGNDGICTQGVDKMEEPKRLKVPLYMFKDTGTFDGNNILTCPVSALNMHMEDYARHLLYLFVPFRSKQDFEPIDPSYNGRFPHVMRLREVNAHDSDLVQAGSSPLFGTEKNHEYLQNIQDCGHNSLRCKARGDDLVSATEPFECDTTGACMHRDDDSDDEALLGEDTTYEAFLAELEPDDLTDTDPTYLPAYLQDFSFDGVRNNGKERNGYYKHLPKVTLSHEVQENVAPDWIFHPMNDTHVTSANRKIKPPCVNPSMRRLVVLLIGVTTRRTREEIFKYNPTAEVIEANGTVKSIFEWSDAAQLDVKQRRSFEMIIAAFLLTFYEYEEDEDDSVQDRSRYKASVKALMILKGGNGRQLILLLHGPGGSGKSTVINLVRDYAKEFCYLIGHTYTIRTIVVTALSGVAATLLHGETTHKALGTNNKYPPTDEEQDLFADTRMLLIDEVSFGSCADINTVEWRFKRLLRRTFAIYGGRNVVFAGDYSQLTPVQQTPIYHEEHPCPAFHGEINAFIELDGMHRFANDPHWGEIMYRFREGRPTIEDVNEVNTKCVVNATRQPPDDVQVAVFRNKNRDAINSAIFDRYCTENEQDDGSLFNDAIVVFMDELEMHDSRKRYIRMKHNSVKKHFWTTCGEDGCVVGGGKKSKGRVDPVLKLYPGCPLMLTGNKDVPNGQANGSRVFLQKVNIKYGEEAMPMTLDSGTKIRAYFASQVETLLLRHEMDDIEPRDFTLQSKSFTFKAKLLLDEEKTTTQMKGTQFPVVSNSATTGHKLQGYTAESLFVMEWLIAATWMYVVLSRVKTMNGLYIKNPLTTDLTKYKMDERMQKMLREFQEKHGVTYFTDAQYASYLQKEVQVDDNHQQRTAAIAALALQRLNAGNVLPPDTANNT